MSSVISVTFLLFCKGIFSKTFIISSDFVPEIIATIHPFLPLADLLVKIVYSSPCEREVSSIDKCFPIFSGKISHSFECDFWLQF
jgi:hypothetical protein